MNVRTFKGRYENLEKIGKFARQAAHEAGLDSRAMYAVETAVDEACSNIIEHAYGGESDRTITCNYQIFPDRLIITLKDSGRPFDPSTVVEPNLNAALEDQPGHGLGMFFMRRMMDEIEFTHDSKGGNTLTMIKFRGKKT